MAVQQDIMEDVFETDNAGLVRSPSIIRTGYCEDRDGTVFAYLEIENMSSGKLSRFWMDAGLLEDVVGGLVDVVPHVV